MASQVTYVGAGVGNLQARGTTPDPYPGHLPDSKYLDSLGMDTGLRDYLDTMFTDTDWSVFTRPATAAGTEPDRHGFVPTSDPRYQDSLEYKDSSDYWEFARDTSDAMLYATLAGKKYGSYGSSIGYYGAEDWTKRTLDFYLNSTANPDFTYTGFTWDRHRPGEICGTATSLNCAYPGDSVAPTQFNWAPILVHPITDAADTGTNNQWPSPPQPSAYLTFDSISHVAIAQKFSPNFGITPGGYAHGLGRVDIYVRGASSSADLIIKIYPACSGVLGTDVEQGIPIFASYVPAGALQGASSFTMLGAYNTNLRRGWCSSIESTAYWIVATTSNGGVTSWGDRSTVPAPPGYESYSKNSQGVWTLDKDAQNNNIWMGFNSYNSTQANPPDGRETDNTFLLALAWADYVHRHKGDSGIQGWAAYTYNNILSKWINYYLQWSGKSTNTCPTPTYVDTWNCQLNLIINTHLEQHPWAHAYDLKTNVLAWRVMRKLVMGEDGYQGVLQEIGLRGTGKCSACDSDASSFPAFVNNLKTGITANLTINTPGGQPTWKLAAKRIRQDNTLVDWPYDDQAIVMTATAAGWQTTGVTGNNPMMTTNVGYGQLRSHFALVSQDGSSHNLWVDINGNTIQDSGETSGTFSNPPSSLTSSATPGQTTLSVSSTTGFSMGDLLQVDNGANLEIRQVASISGSTSITVTSAFSYSHNTNVPVYKSWSPSWTFDYSQGVPRTPTYSDVYPGSPTGGGSWTVTSLPYSDITFAPFLYGNNQFDEARDRNGYSDWKTRQIVTWPGTVRASYDVIRYAPTGTNRAQNAWGKMIANEMIFNWYINDKTRLKSVLEFFGDYHAPGTTVCRHGGQIQIPVPSNGALQNRQLYPEQVTLSIYNNLGVSPELPCPSSTSTLTSTFQTDGYSDWTGDSGNMEQSAFFLFAMYHLTTDRLLDNFDDDCNLSPWSSSVARGNTVQVRNTLAYSTPCSLFISYSGSHGVARATSPAVGNLDPSQDYTISLWFRVPSAQTYADKYMVVLDDSRAKVFYASGSLKDGAGFLITNINKDAWYNIKVLVHPGASTKNFYVVVTPSGGVGTQYGPYSLYGGTLKQLALGSEPNVSTTMKCDAYWDDVQLLPWIS